MALHRHRTDSGTSLSDHGGTYGHQHVRAEYRSCQNGLALPTVSEVAVAVSGSGLVVKRGNDISTPPSLSSGSVKGKPYHHLIEMTLG